MILIKVTYSSTQPTIKVTYDVTNITVSGGNPSPVYVNLDYSASGAATNITSVGLTMPTGFSVANSPLTSSGTLAVTMANGYIIPTQAELDAKVPYSGATGNVNLGEYGIKAGYYQVDTTPTNTPADQGTMYWDDSKETISLIMDGTIQHIGQDSYYYVKNSSGSTITKGTAVRFAGTNGASGHVLIEPFLANGTYPSEYFMGVTCETIPNGGFGQVMNFGELEGVDTSAYNEGDLLYASTTIAGGFQTTPPNAPNNIILIAAAVNSKNNGAILIRPTYGSNINNDEGVLITSPQDNDVLTYNSATSLWKNESIASIVGSTYVQTSRTLTINDVAYDLSADRSWSIGDYGTW